MCNLYSGQRKHPGAAHCPTVRGKQLSDRRCPLDPGEHEEAECEFFYSRSIQFELTNTTSTNAANCRTLRQAESRSFVLEGFRNSELIQDLGKLQIQRHGGAKGRQVGKQEISNLYGNAKARTRLRTRVRVRSAQDGAT